MKKSLYNPNKPPLKVSWIYLHPFLFSNFLVTDFLQKWKLWCCCDPSVLKQMNWNQASMAHFGQYYYQLRSQDTLFGIEVPYYINRLVTCKKGKILIGIYSKRPKLFFKMSKLISKKQKLISKSLKLISAGFHLSDLDWILHKKACKLYWGMGP